MYGQCFYPNCERPAAHDHHVTYKPPVTKPLCRQHHEDITIINCNRAARRFGAIKFQKLSNKYRWWIWFQWIEGNLEPIRTPGALKWIAKWKKDENHDDDNSYDPSFRPEPERNRPTC